MRTLLLMRGAPGCGKSTWIKENNLQQYTLSPDDIRVLCASTELLPDGNYKITQDRFNEEKVWNVLFDLLEYRMSRGEFTVIDATCSKTKDIQQYKDLAEHYRYRVFIVDFTDVPLDVCLKQNKLRPEYKHVPDNVIENIYSRFATQAIPKGVKVIKPNELDTILEKPIDVSEYKKLVFIGDIHGCYDTLMQYPDFKEGLKDDTEYIFLGDYIDRGNQNVEVLKFLSSIMDKPNVCLLEGNHERSIQAYGNNVVSTSKEFEKNTRKQLINNMYSDKEARMLYRKFRQFSHITFNGLEILACHGGIPNLSKNLLFLPTNKFINGSGDYKDYIVNSESWMSQTKDNCYLIHGHRNIEDSETQIADRVFNLEGRVEFGGQLRIVELENVNAELKWNVVLLDDCQPITEELNTEERKVETIGEAVTYLRNNRFVQEKELGNGISSFNFTREAFMKGNWNRQTILARGLFIDTENNKIIARSYEKFFKIGEVSSTQLAVLKDRLQFPVKAYVKENGFLAIVSYDYKNDDLFIASKSTNKGDYVEYIKAQLEPYRENILEFLRNNYETCEMFSRPTSSLVFECIDIENDPHIIKYNENKLVLLDAIYNQLAFKTYDYKEVKVAAELIGCPVKELAYEFKDWDSFRTFYNECTDDDYKYKDNYIEGFVFVDDAGFMTKVKGAYYNQWKKLRGVAEQTLRCGYITRTGMLINPLENMFYGFCKDLFKYKDKDTKTYPFKTDIISLRDKYNKQKFNIGNTNNDSILES